MVNGYRASGVEIPEGRDAARLKAREKAHRGVKGPIRGLSMIRLEGNGWTQDPRRVKGTGARPQDDLCTLTSTAMPFAVFVVALRHAGWVPTRDKEGEVHDSPLWVLCVLPCSVGR
jgi:hypothetical protein